MHILGATLSLAMAAIVLSVVLSEHSELPGLVTLLCVTSIVVLVVNAVRVYRSGRERIRRTEGPRTRIVLSDPSSSNPPTHTKHPSDD